MKVEPIRGVPRLHGAMRDLRLLDAHLRAIVLGAMLPLGACDRPEPPRRPAPASLDPRPELPEPPELGD